MAASSVSNVGLRGGFSVCFTRKMFGFLHLSRSLTATLFSRSAQGYMKRALPSSDPTFESSTDLSRKWEPGLGDGEFDTLLRDATEQGNGEDKEEIEEEKQNSEASTEAGVLSYDEMR